MRAGQINRNQGPIHAQLWKKLASARDSSSNHNASKHVKSGNGWSIARKS